MEIVLQNTIWALCYDNGQVVEQGYEEAANSTENRHTKETVLLKTTQSNQRKQMTIVSNLRTYHVSICCCKYMEK